MTKLKWESEGKKLFDKIISAVPAAMQEMVKPKLLEMLAQRAKGSPVTKDILIDMVKQDLPEPQRSTLLKVIGIEEEKPKAAEEPQVPVEARPEVDLVKIEQIVSKYPEGIETLVSILHEIKSQFGYIPQESLYLINEKKKIPLSHLYRVVTSNRCFSLEPPKAKVVKVCYGSGCQINYPKGLLSKLEKEAQKGNFTLEKIKCLGCCDLSPVVIVNGEFFSGEMANKKITELVEG